MIRRLLAAAGLVAYIPAKNFCLLVQGVDTEAHVYRLPPP